MVQSPSWEANWFAASQVILCISRNPKVHYRTHKRPPPTPSWARPIQSIYPHPTSWRSVLISSTHLRLGLPSGLFLSGFSTKTLYTPLSSPICAKCPAHLILHDFITRTILGEEYKSFSSSLCNLLHSPTPHSLMSISIVIILSHAHLSPKISSLQVLTYKIWHEFFHLILCVLHDSTNFIARYFIVYWYNKQDYLSCSLEILVTIKYSIY